MLETSREEKAFYLKYLIHCLADLHQPLHTGREEDKGGNSIYLKYSRKKNQLFIAYGIRISLKIMGCLIQN